MTRNPMSVCALAALALLAGLAAGPLAAASGSSAPVPEAPSPEQVAISEYNAGLELRDKAMEADGEAQAAGDAKTRAKLEAKRDELFGKAARRFEAAVAAKPDYAPAYGSLGYAQRRLGSFEEAMSAYDTALTLNPNYPPAMEYRAEALLGLGRVAEAQEAYEKLSIVSAEHAAQLLTAIESWAGDERNAAAAAEADLDEWIAARMETAGTIAASTEGGQGSWR